MEPELEFQAPALGIYTFGSGMIWSTKNSKSLHYLYKTLAPPTRAVELEPKFQAPAPTHQSFDSGSSFPKLVGLRLHSPGLNQCVHKAPFRILWHY